MPISLPAAGRRNSNYQYNLPDIEKKIAYKANREGVAERFPDESVKKSIELDLKLLDYYDQLLPRLEHEISLIAKAHDADSYFRIRSIPGIGRILGLVILYEIHDIHRFPRVQDFVSYCRLVKSAKESAGKRLGTSGKKIGNAHLKLVLNLIGDGPSLKLPCFSSEETLRPENTERNYKKNTARPNP